MNKICTSLEQSKKLIKLGVDVNTADMGWNVFVDETTRILPIDDWDLVKNGSGNVKFYPAWSLTALLDIIPNWTMDKTDKVNLTCNSYYHCESFYEDPVDAAFEMVCWLLENGKL